MVPPKRNKKKNKPPPPKQKKKNTNVGRVCRARDYATSEGIAGGSARNFCIAGNEGHRVFAASGLEERVKVVTGGSLRGSGSERRERIWYSGSRPVGMWDGAFPFKVGGRIERRRFAGGESKSAEFAAGRGAATWQGLGSPFPPFLFERETALSADAFQRSGGERLEWRRRPSDEESKSTRPRTKINRDLDMVKPPRLFDREDSELSHEN